VDISSFQQWLRQLDTTRDDEISCSDCLALVSGYVDREVGGDDRAIAQASPRLVQHLEQCAACREEYEVLRDLAERERDGSLPSIDELRALLSDPEHR
jgi:hypothetical protein